MTRKLLLAIALVQIGFLTSASAVTITGFGDIGLGERAPGGGTIAGTGEEGNYLYLEFSSDIAGLSLVSASWDFTGHNVFYDAAGLSFVPPVNNGVTSFAFSGVQNAQTWSMTFAGFDSGDNLQIGLDLDSSTMFGGTPLGSDYAGGTLTVSFNNGTTLNGTFVELDVANGRATFSFSDGGAAVPDAGSTWMLLALACAGLQVIRRKLPA